jgi:phospholipid transport system substrate-binding protein
MTLHRFFLHICSLLCIAFLSMSAYAQSATDTPDGLVRMLVNDVMTTVKSDPEMQAGDVQKIRLLVEQKIKPHTDFDKTTALAMGPSWREASPEQQKQIKQQFELLLIHTYAGAIAQIRDQQVQFGRVRESNNKAMVPTTVINNGEKMPINYRLENIDGQWKVYDMNVLGVWLVEVYKTQFKEQISKTGINGLIQFLKSRNQALAKGQEG